LAELLLFLPLSGKTSYCRDGFFHEKKTFFTQWQKLANPGYSSCKTASPLSWLHKSRSLTLTPTTLRLEA